MSDPQLFDEAPSKDSGTLQFRVVSGPNMGATLALSAGRYLIGTSAAAEILLQEPCAQEPCLVALTLDDALKVSVTLEQGAAKLAGVSLSQGQSTAMDAGELLVIGLSALTYLAEGQSLEQLDLSALGLVAPAPQPAAEPEPPTEAKEAAEAQAPAAPATEPEPAAEPVAEAKPSRALYLWTALGLLLCALALGALVVGSSWSQSQAQADAALAQAKAYLTDPDFAEVTVQLKQQTLYFTGTLPSAESFLRFTEELPAFPYGVVLNLTVRDRTLLALEHSAAVYGATVTARYRPGSDGQVIELYGYVKDPYVEAALIKQLNAAQPHVTLQPHLSYEPQVRRLMTDLCPAALHPVTFAYENLGVYYEGALTLEQAQALAELNAALNHALKTTHFALKPRPSPQQIATLERTAPAAPTAPTAQTAPAPEVDPQLGFDPADIVGVTLHPMRFVSMKDGSKFFEGALLPNGCILKTIALDHLVLQQGSEVFDYGLN